MVFNCSNEVLNDEFFTIVEVFITPGRRDVLIIVNYVFFVH